MRRRTETSAEPDNETSGLVRAQAQADAAFDELLREAAHLSDPAVAPGLPPLVPGGTLAGDRLQVLRYLGRGGMGVVYEVFDAERRETMALKLLSRLGPSSIYRLKNEFRALADLRHPNLVLLHELFAEGERWYYTMALVDGIPFDRYVRPDDVLAVERLRACLVQLFEAVSAIHGAGKLHRDLKPSNVLVTATGGLVVLDFGLSVDAAQGGVGQTVTEQLICGTPGYMAPEQASGRRPCAESDLYAIGVMLFEALTGRLPFSGTAGEMLAAKQRDEAPRAGSLDASVPADLDALCASLLERDPSLRSPLTIVQGERATPAGARRLFGRETELDQLRAAYTAACAGVPTVVRVIGESGIGKTALCEAFLDELRALPDVLLLEGRCYERESVPFKLFDPLIDAISRALRRLPEEMLRQLVPRDAFALCCLFPVLGRVRELTVPAPRAMPDAQELRQRAVPALFELLASLRAESPLVIFLDDLQWADGDSLTLLQELLGNRAGFPALLVASHRTEPRPGARLDVVFDAAHDHGVTAVQALVLGPLAHEDTMQLVAALAHETTATTSDLDAVARESGGHPLFASELTHFAHRAEATTLDAALTLRIAALAPRTRALLELLALSAEPLLARVALQAADARHEDLEQLQRARLVRTSGSHRAHGSGKTLECFHDRVRESVFRKLDEARRRTHARRLAEVLEKLDDASAELLRRCLFEAGEVARAAGLAAEAARVAGRSMAFERAAELYRQALAYCDPSDRALRVQLGTELGDVLGYAGRTAEAASAHRAAAELAPEDKARELLRRVAANLMFSGLHDEGVGLMKRLCDEAKVRLPRSEITASAELALMRVRLRVRGFALRAEERPTDRERIETLSTVASGLSNYQPLYAAVVSLQYLMAALDAGDARHAVLALQQCANLDARLSYNNDHRVDVYLARMRDLMPDAMKRHPFIVGFERLTRGTQSMRRCDYAAARAWLLPCLDLSDSLPGSFVLRDYVHMHLQNCYHAMGDYAEIVRTTPPVLQQMLLHGRGFAAAYMIAIPALMAWLVPDDPDAVERRIDEVRGHIRSAHAAHLQRLALLVSELSVYAYRGEFDRAFEIASQQLPLFDRANLSRMFGLPKTTLVLGQAAIGLLPSARGRQRTTLRAIGERSVKEVSRQRHEHWYEMAIPLAAALAVDRGDHASAVALLRRPTYRWAAGAPYGARQIVIGRLTGGDEGRARISEGRALLRAHGVVNEEAFLRVHFPSCSPR